MRDTQAGARLSKSSRAGYGAGNVWQIPAATVQFKPRYAGTMQLEM
jgi:hypothetical protein